MRPHVIRSFRSAIICGVLSILALSTVAFAQDPATDPSQAPPPTTPGWRRFSPPPQPAAPPQAPPAQADSAPPVLPERITIPAGTFVTVRLDQFLSSDKNKAGDSFSATLSRPLLADGFVVARRAETIGGRVVDAKKAGRVKGVSHLQIALNTLTLADGQQVPVETALTSITGNTSKGRDAAAIAGTTAAGAAIGAAADWGVGAALGAGAGLVASTVGVLVTRGHPTVIYPESQLTFRLAKPVTFSTARAPQAFAAVSAASNMRAAAPAPPQGPPPAYAGCPGPGCAPYPPPYYLAPYYPYPYFWGPSFGFYFGRGFYARGFRYR